MVRCGNRWRGHLYSMTSLRGQPTDEVGQYPASHCLNAGRRLSFHIAMITAANTPHTITNALMICFGSETDTAAADKIDLDQSDRVAIRNVYNSKESLITRTEGVAL
jgi:hypothetical protein